MPRKKPGTAKKPTVEAPPRYADGQLRHDPEAPKEFAPTIIKRLKDELIPKAKDKRLGSVLGLMHLDGILAEVEVEAGFRYAADVGAYERMMGHPSRSARSASYEGGFRGASGLDLDALRRMDPDTADKVEREIKRRRKAIQKRYDKVQACVPMFPILVSTILEEVCCNDRPVHSLHHDTLRKILRNIAERCYPAILHASKEARQRRVSKSADAEYLAQGAIDALTEHFAKRSAVVATFLLSPTKPRGIAPAITAYGHTLAGNPIEHTIKLNRSGLMTEAIHAQLLKAATAKGWQEATITTKCTSACAIDVDADSRVR